MAAAGWHDGGMITHVVIFWTDKPGSEDRTKLLEGAKALLGGIPGVREFRTGAPVPSPRGVVDDSFAVAISMTFASQADADAYQTHPDHQVFIDDYVKPYVKRFVVYDFGQA
ncbi:MAG: Dabb family protein [Puniceicoccaceae bacterium]|nr:MAG: Dabb family protein [Puniceicoccaceae bacterium]